MSFLAHGYDWVHENHKIGSTACMIDEMDGLEISKVKMCPYSSIAAT
jgi:hypothetical protein